MQFKRGNYGIILPLDYLTESDKRDQTAIQN